MGRDNLRHSSPMYTLALHLFRQYLVDHDKTTQDAEGVSLKDFYYYLRGKDELFPDREELMITYDVTDEELLVLEEAVKEPFQFMTELFLMWPMISYAFRERPAHQPVYVELSATLAWDDRATSLPCRIAVPEEMPVEGFVLTSWRKALYDTMNLLMSLGGTDGLYTLSNKVEETDPDEGVVNVNELMAEDSETEEDW